MFNSVTMFQQVKTKFINFWRLRVFFLVKAGNLCDALYNISNNLQRIKIFCKALFDFFGMP